MNFNLDFVGMQFISGKILSVNIELFQWSIKLRTMYYIFGCRTTVLYTLFDRIRSSLILLNQEAYSVLCTLLPSTLINISNYFNYFSFTFLLDTYYYTISFRFNRVCFITYCNGKVYTRRLNPSYKRWSSL
jgi:hypothetical protein